MKRHAGMFKPGQSGNPSGRPKSAKAITDLSLEILAEPFDDPMGLYPRFKDISKGEVILRQLIDKATYGDISATKELLDRLIGKPKQMLESKRLTMNYQDFLDALDEKSD